MANVNGLKPSEAMRIGIRKTRPITGELYSKGEHQGHPLACALGAMGVGYGISRDKMVNGDGIYGKFPQLQKLVVHPADEVFEGDAPDKDTVEDIIVSLNDNHGWHRGRIANWLRKIGL